MLDTEKKNKKEDEIMGLLDDYGINANEVDAVVGSDFNIPDDTYEWVIGDLFVKEGSTNNPDKSWIILEYLVGDEGKKFSEMWQLPADAANPTEDEKKKLGRYKARIMSLGFAENEVNSVDKQAVVGITGTFRLKTTTDKKDPNKKYQNIAWGTYVVNDREEGSNAFQAPVAEAAPRATRAAAKSAPAAKPAAAEQAAPTAVRNPFAGK